MRKGTHVTSPLVSRLVSAIDSSLDQESRAILCAELACYWARTGEFEEAERLRLELRREFGTGQSIRVSILIMCIEALLAYYRELSPGARDRMARASLLSKASKDARLMALTSAWMAHIDFNLNRFESMAAELAICFQCLDADDGTAECRASLVLGDSFLFLGDTPVSQAWYEKARRAAVRIGDQAAVGAMTYNRAALRVSITRLQGLTGHVADDAIAMVRAEVESAINYQAVARLRSLDHLLQSARAGVLILQQKFEEAHSTIRPLLAASEVSEGTAQRMLLEADLARALSALGLSKEAESWLLAFSSESAIAYGADDRALILSSVAKAARSCGYEGAADRLEAEMMVAVKQHAVVLAALRGQLSKYEGPNNLIQQH